MERLKKVKKPSPFENIEFKKRFLDILFESNPHFVERYGKEERMYSYTLLAAAIIAILQLSISTVFIYYSIAAQIIPSVYYAKNESIIFQNVLDIWGLFAILSVLTVIPGFYAGRLIPKLERVVKVFLCEDCKKDYDLSGKVLDTKQEAIHSVIHPEHRVSAKELDTVINWKNATGNTSIYEFIIFSVAFFSIGYLIKHFNPNSFAGIALTLVFLGIIIAVPTRVLVVNAILRSRPSNVSLTTLKFSTYKISEENDLHIASVRIYRVSKRQYDHRAFLRASGLISPEWVHYYLAEEVETDIMGNLKSVIPAKGTAEYKQYRKTIEKFQEQEEKG